MKNLLVDAPYPASGRPAFSICAGLKALQIATTAASATVFINLQARCGREYSGAIAGAVATQVTSAWAELP